MPENPDIHANALKIRKVHRNQLILQIILPILLVGIIGIILVILSLFAGKEEVSVWSSISLIFLVIPTMVISLVVLLILGFGVYGMSRVLKIIPKYTNQFQEKINKVEMEIRKVSNGVVKPFISIRSAAAGINTIVSKLSRKEK
jgi:predicted PurR-regulated permease PerM